MRSAALVATIVACILFVPWKGLPSSSGEAPEEVIVYTTLRPVNQDIYLIDGPDAKPRRITDHLALDYNATFSPDGRWVVFTSERDGNVDLYALDLEAESDPIRLTRDPGLDDAADISPDGEWMVFTSTRRNGADVYVMPFIPGDAGAEDDIRKLTSNEGDDFNPTFSPDGSMIAWTHRRGPLSNWRNRFLTEVFVMEADGSGTQRLIDGKNAISGAPAWTPDGDAIYVHGTRTTDSMDSLYVREGWNYRIWRVSLDGSNVEAITGPAFAALAPTVGPKGRVAFNRGPRTPPLEAPELPQSEMVQSVGPEGSSPRALVDSTLLDVCLAPAYDNRGRIACHGPGPTDRLRPKTNGDPLLRPGTNRTVSLPDRTVTLVGIHGYFPDILASGRMVYGETVSRGESVLASAALDGSKQQVVLKTDSLGAWATAACPQNDRIAFSRGPSFASVDTPVDIWTMGSDGSNPINLTRDPTSNDAFPDWSADCEEIVFRSGRDGNKEIYLMNADGSNLTRLTHHPATDTAPALSPDGNWVVFSTARDSVGYRLRLQRTDGREGRFLEPDLVGTPIRDMHPRFSQDGTWIVFVSDRGGMADEFVMTGGPQPYGELWAIPREGGSAIRLTHNKWEDGLARWGIVP